MQSNEVRIWRFKQDAYLVQRLKQRLKKFERRLKPSKVERLKPIKQGWNAYKSNWIELSLTSKNLCYGPQFTLLFLVMENCVYSLSTASFSPFNFLSEKQTWLPCFNRSHSRIRNANAKTSNVRGNKWLGAKLTHVLNWLIKNSLVTAAEF